MLDFICMAPVDLSGAHTRSGRMFDRVLHVESKHRTCASLCYLHNIPIFQYFRLNSTFSRQNTLHFIILELIPIYTLVSEVYVCIKVIYIIQLSSKPDYFSW